jgi:hypothetical protein
MTVEELIEMLFAASRYSGSSALPPELRSDPLSGRQSKRATHMSKQAAVKAAVKQETRTGSKGTTHMSKEPAKQETQTSMALTTHGTELENIAMAAQQDAGFEKILKFKKGEYFVAEEEIPLGSEYLAHVVGWTKCWIKFVDGEVAERKIYPVAKGARPPEREDLDDLDESKWEEGLDGKPADPWVYQYLLPLENRSNGELVIFVTSSFGGRRAVADLCQLYTRRMQKMGAGQPIISWRRPTCQPKSSARCPGRCSKSSAGTTTRLSHRHRRKRRQAARRKRRRATT